jgi:glycosyltransferase involved in cell wall biosynthesis
VRITVLWSRLADYTTSFFRALAEQGCELQLVFHAAGGELQFNEFDVSFCREAIRLPNPQQGEFEAAVGAFAAECVLTSGWNFRRYMPVARKRRDAGAVVITSLDNPWRGDLRQRAGGLAAPWLLHRTIDALFVAGARQAEFARRLGYYDYFPGLYCANVGRFGALKPLAQRPNRFVFVGRFIERKGVPELLDAYRAYRDAVTEPMELLMAGSGPLEARCRATPGVDVRGFVQPEELPSLFEQAQCLILPSRIEHWGVILHEAAAAGLPLIATEECGATDAFLRDGGNGFLVTRKPGALGLALRAFHDAAAVDREEFSRNSARLAWAWTPELQARHFVRHVGSLRDGRAAR